MIDKNNSKLGIYTRNENNRYSKLFTIDSCFHYTRNRIKLAPQINSHLELIR